MKLYTAAIYTNQLEIGGKYWQRMDAAERGHRQAVRYILESYHYVNMQHRVDAMRQDKVKIFLDSGAFSAFTQGVTIDINEYCNYIRRNRDIIECCSVLDAVGDPSKTLNNQAIMEEQGVAALPCYHYGEDESYLANYLDGYEYITIGGMVPISTPQLRIWLDRIWSRYLCRHDGTPRVKVHAFGMTNQELMARYPWHSVDSSSWVYKGNMGFLLVPNFGTIRISEGSETRKVDGAHVDSTTSPLERDACLAQLICRGFNPQRLRTEYLSRWIFNIATYHEINLELEKKELKFKLAQQTIF